MPNDIIPPRNSSDHKAEARASITRELPVSGFHKELEKCITKLGGRVKHCGRSAFHHLRRAWILHGIDNEMSAFRAITAEEEAASALILSVQQKRYTGADKLNFRNHVHKTALIPFLNAVRKLLEETDFAKATLKVRSDLNPPRINFFMDAKNIGLDTPKPLFIEPDEPLNIIIHLIDKDGNKSIHKFEEQLQEITEGSGLDDIAKFISSEANLRNRLLYASDKGLPAAKFGEEFLLERLRRVTLLVILTIMIQQTSEHQLFATQCLRALLIALKRIPDEPFDFELIKSSEIGIIVNKEDNTEPKARFHKN